MIVPGAPVAGAIRRAWGHDCGPLLALAPPPFLIPSLQRLVDRRRTFGQPDATYSKLKAVKHLISTPEAVLARFGQTRLVVAGDVMLDRYVYGSVARISPEAPVPVVRKTRETAAPGGAANTAANIRALGAQVRLLGVIGRDEGATVLRKAMINKKISDSDLLVDAARPTSVKTRIVAQNQHVVRVDVEDNAPLATELAERFVSNFEQALQDVDAVVLSDYAKGVLPAMLLPRLIGLARAAKVPVLADPKSLSPAPWNGVRLLKPNRLELGVLASMPTRNHAETCAAAIAVLPQLGGGALLVTEGAEGMTLFEPGQEPKRFQSVTRTVYDVTGAGDTVLATVAVALAAGATTALAAELAQRAASLVVQKLGTEIIDLQELISSFQD